MRIKKKSTIIIWCLVVVSSICLWNVISIQNKYNNKIYAIDIMFLSKLRHVNLTSSNKRTKELSIECIAQAEALIYFTSYYKDNNELCQCISRLYELDLSNEKLQPFYSDIQAYIKKLHSNPNDRDIAKEFLKFIEEIPRIN